MKRFTSLMLMLLVAVTTWAQSVVITEGLPGTLTTFEGGGHNQYEWTSGKITPKSDFNAIRIKFIEAKMPMETQQQTRQVTHLSLLQSSSFMIRMEKK